MELEYTANAHLTLTIIGLVLLVILVFTLRAEVTFLAQYRTHKVQTALSLLSIGVMFFLTLTLLLHWSLSPFFVFTTIMLLTPLLLILAVVILYLRAKAFTALVKQRRRDQVQLIREVQELLDEKKREKIREQKIARGEPVDE